MPTKKRSKKPTRSESIRKTGKKPYRNRFGRFHSSDQSTQKAIIETIHPNGTHEYHQLHTQFGYSPLCDMNDTILEGIIQQPSNFRCYAGLFFQFFKHPNLNILTPSTPKKPKLPSLLKTPGGTQYNTKRNLNISVQGKSDSTLYLYSPQKGRPLQSVKKPCPKKAIIFSSIKSPIKGGVEMPVEIGAHNRKEAKAQLAVMHIAAKKAMLEYIEKNKEKLLEQNIYELLNKTANTPRLTEWCHAIGHSLSPKTFNPQVSENLGTAFEWINTFMMVLEEVARHYAKRYPEAVSILPTFHMIPNTDIIKKVDYLVNLKIKGKSEISISNEVDALTEKNRSTWPAEWDAHYVIQAIDYKLQEQDKLTNGLCKDLCP